MSLSANDIKKIAQLAQLHLNDQQIDAVRADMEKTLYIAAAMDRVDTAGVLPMAHPSDTSQPLREDIITESNARETYQAIAPNVQSGLYIVPKMIESE